MAIVRWDPFRELTTLDREMGRLVDRAFGLEGRGPWSWATGMWAPAVDMYETDKELVVKAELPGLTTQDIDISLTDSTLSIKGEKKSSEEVKEESYYRVERHYGSFQRMIDLPKGVKRTRSRPISRTAF